MKPATLKLLGILTLVAASCGILTALGVLLAPFVVIAALLATLVLYVIFVHPLAGFYMVSVFSYFIAYPSRILGTNIPISTGIEVLVLLLFISSFSSRKKIDPESIRATSKADGGNQFSRYPVSIAFLAFSLFILIQLFNPNMLSTSGWLFYARRATMFILIYIIGYRLLDEPKKIRNFLMVWFGMATFTSAYACYQHWFGMLPFEMAYLRSHPHEYKLYFQGGTIRKFSILSDPTTFGILAGASSIFMMIAAINEKNKRKKRIYFLCFTFLVLGMAYSGTRTTNIMLPVAIILYALMTITSRTTIITLFVFLFAVAFILFGPIHNSTVNRIRSTFDTKEESASVRDINRKYIQPYIYAHPLGGGIMTSGLLGEQYNPGHVLAGFPPDSGLLQVAMEQGWIGYAITILMYFMMLYQCIRFYFMTPNRQYRTWIIGITCSVFAVIMTQYAQVAIGQLPTAFFFYSSFAIVARLKELGNAHNTPGAEALS